MTTTKKLQITPEQYENKILNLYIRWCESVSMDVREFQLILANSAINNWFRFELTKLEKEFHLLTDRYLDGNIIAKDYEACYDRTTLNIFNYRPMALLEGIKKRPKGILVLTALNQN